MPNSVLPLPTGFGVTAITEHRPHRQPDPHPPAEEEPQAGQRDGAEGGEQQPPATPRDLPPPLTDEIGVDPETLFATALFANQLPPGPTAPRNLPRRAGSEWSPPESQLRLRDKLI